MTRFVFLSGRLHSGASLLRVVGKYGKHDVKAIHVNTGYELRDYLTFASAVCRHVDVPLTVLTGSGVNEFFRTKKEFRQGLKGGCHLSTKMVPIVEYCNLNVNKQDDILYFGQGNLNNSVNNTIARWLEGYTIRFPMHSLPLVNHDQLVEYFLSLDIPLPSIYGMGLIGANCKGGCIHYTIRDWVQLYMYDQSLFSQWENLENDLLAINPKNYVCIAMYKGSLRGISLCRIREYAETIPYHSVHRAMGSCLTDRSFKPNRVKDDYSLTDTEIKIIEVSGTIL